MTPFLRPETSALRQMCVCQTHFENTPRQFPDRSVGVERSFGCNFLNHACDLRRVARVKRFLYLKKSPY